jgi:glucoamylase
MKRVFASVVLSSVALSTVHAESIEEWLARQNAYSKIALLKNISPLDGARGAVMASPSRANPDYYYHWIRDAALVFNQVFDLLQSESSWGGRANLEEMLWDYANLSRRNQETPNRSGDRHTTGMGEPKFNIDGSAFNGDWGRPQNDGPPLRAVTLVRFANYLLDHGKEADVRNRLYDSRIPTNTVIKADLEFVAHHWREASFDLWEENKAQHFYTRLAQRRSLLSGAQLAERLGDTGAAVFYRKVAKEMETEIDKHWSAERGYIIASLDRSEGIDYKHSQIDVAVVLAALHSYDPNDTYFSPFDPRIKATVEKIEEAFGGLYEINKNTVDHYGEKMSAAIGRYPEDTYDGYGSGRRANPWFLATLSLAEYYFMTGDNAKAFEKLRRVRYHAAHDHSLSEQFHRDNGYMTGAPELTWSHAAVLSSTAKMKKYCQTSLL